EKWRPMSEAPRAFTVPRQLAVDPRGWQSMPFFQGYRGVVYNLSRNASRSLLFVVDVRPQGELPSSPPLTPQFSSGGRCVAAWLVKNRMYVLVAKGDERLYRQLIRVSSPVLAHVMKMHRSLSAVQVAQRL